MLSWTFFVVCSRAGTTGQWRKLGIVGTVCALLWRGGIFSLAGIHVVVGGWTALPGSIVTRTGFWPEYILYSLFCV
jgi:hypothetical protein